jgi:hypothetical protein
MLTRSVDIVLVAAYCLALGGGILPFVLRRRDWVRGLCVGFILLASFFAVVRVYLSAHMAINQLNAERRTSRASFVEGARYAGLAAITTLPIFIFAIGGLSAMALLPSKSR